jgi:hypothetical protein
MHARAISTGELYPAAPRKIFNRNSIFDAINTTIIVSYF